MNWQRSTKALTPSSLPPQVAAAIRVYQENTGQPAALTHADSAWEIVSSRPRRLLDFLSRVPKHERSIVLLGPEWLIWVAMGDHAEVEWRHVNLLRLRDLTVQDYEGTLLAKQAPDTGVTLSWQGASHAAVTRFLGLGPEPASAELRARLHQATRR